MMEFVDLQRQFHDVPKDVELEETEHLVSFSEHEFGPSFGWSKLLESMRVVLLAEAGSGKTKEMEEQAKRLAQEGRFAFFVALDDLDRERMVNILSPDEEESFKRWRANGQETAWFFLDAVDELKLTGGKLSRALNRLSKDLNGFLDRARVIISCRPSDWRPIVDLDTVQNGLPIPQRSSHASLQPSEEVEEVFVQALRKDLGHTNPDPGESENSADRDGVRIVRMFPMNRTQIKLFAEQSGVNDAAGFLEEINRENAGTFAQRPLDLSDLITAWTTSGSLGTREQQHEGNIAAKLKDDPDRRDRGVLSDARARLGAERLALALALTRKRTIRSPEQAPVTHATDGILDPAKILTHWTEEERQALLRRALFDPATYGRIRFHHRSIQEYLAACRLWELRNEGMSTKALFRLLFAESFGYRVVLSSMCAITAWLALWDDAVRQELIAREPETLISFGDPGALPLSARKELVRAFVGVYGDDDGLGPMLLVDDVRRLAHPELAPVIRECWEAEPVNHDVRGLLLQLIWFGPVQGCADLAHIAAGSTAWKAGNRIAAIRALLACGCNDRVREFANEMLSHPESWPAEIVFGVASDMFSDVIKAQELVTLIERRSSVSGIVFENLDWSLQRVVESIEPGSDQAVDLRGKLADLIWNGREETQELHDIRSEFDYLAPTLAMLCERQLPEASGRPCKELIRACVIASRFDSEGSIRRYPVRGLRECFDTNSNWRDGAFWAELELMDKIIPSDDPRLRLHYATTDSLVGYLDIANRPWLETALEDESHPERRTVALYALIQIWRARGQDPADLETIRTKLRGDTVLGRMLTDSTVPSDRDEKLERMKQGRRDEARARDEREAQRLEGWKKWRREILANPAGAFSRAKLGVTMDNLYRWLSAAKSSRTRYGLWDKKALTEAFGPMVANLAETAFRGFWRSTIPIPWSGRPADKRGDTPYDWIYGPQGLQAEASAPGWTAALSSAEASTAAAYATIELNGFAPFISELAKSHPQEVETVIGGEVSAELKVGGSHGHLSTLQNLAYADSNLKQLVIRRLTTELKSWPEAFTEDTAPNWAHHLDHVLRILDSANWEADRQAIAQECAHRYEADRAGLLALDWLGGLFRFDAVRGTEALIQQLADGNDPGTREWAIRAFAALFARGSFANFEAIDMDQRTRLLGQLVRYACAFIRPEDDEVHEGVYTPNTRDDAEKARRSLISWLRDTPGTETCRILLELAEEQDFVNLSDHLRSLARQRAATDAEFPPFGTEDVIALESRYEAPPQDRDGLFAVMMDRLDDLQHDLAHDDFSDRRTLQGIKDEAEMQRTLARRIREQANSAYLVTREEEVVDGKRTDIRLSTTNGDQKAVIEVKIADKRWTLTDLERALREQLVGKYLRHANCKAGCLLLTCHGKEKYWIHPETRKQVKFSGIIKFLNDKARTLQSEKDDVRIAVFGLDLTDPVPNNPDFEERIAQAENIIGRYRNTLHILSK